MSKPPLPLPNEQPSTLQINITQFLQSKDFEEKSPYNVFLEGQKLLIVIANQDPTDVANIQLLTLGLSSLIEHYFRSVISKALLLCPQSKDGALRNAQISLAAASYYKNENLGRAIFDNVNFSDSKIIMEQTDDFLGINLKSSSDNVKTALSDLQKIFILRHAVVHANGFLSPKNLMELKSNYQTITAVSTSYASFENMVEVALNSIQTYNSFIFSCLLKRAYQKEYIKFDSAEADIKEFEKYWLLFLGEDTPEADASISSNYQKAKLHFAS
ncbi:hypothetical protein GTP45_25605 [Pseudoduganella sp. FT55W]|uniref:RiboL-PSP-HEPN domain-containing protein n=1 Tax=Duganella rivi TaxID=2666083 RepID=A0A7X4GX24_9BURK|nr:hypothetical protein [Duganella rivi]MYM70154.1 hypothetical protein [Duganella rivi]